MKKKMIAVVVMGLLAAMFSGCQNGEQTNDSSAITTQASEESKASAQEGAAKPTAAPTATPSFAQILNNANIGDTVTFGRYEQDNDLNNGAEDIQWYVLGKEDGKVLLLSKYALDCKKYHDSLDSMTWESSTIRGWLNGDFYQAAFSSEEQEAIMETLLVTEDNTRFYGDYFVEGGNDTQDKVFLLSLEEAIAFLYPGIDMTEENGADLNVNPMAPAKVSEYARAQGAAVYSEAESGQYNATEYDGNGIWWMRSPGSNQTEVIAVAYNGYFGYLYARCNDVCVRPAVWININK